MERYIELFSSLRTQAQKGKPAPHKAILLLSVSDLIASGEIKTVCIDKSPALIKRFKANWETFVNDDRDKYGELIKSPFKHMVSEGFWTLASDEKHAYIESPLFFLLKKEETRTTLRNILIDTYLKQYQPSRTIHKVDFAQLNAAADTTLRPYQIDNKAQIYDFWHTGKSVMLQMPTGTGKTRLFVSIVKDLHNWGKQNSTKVKVLLLAHRKELIQQIAQNVNIKYNLSHGIIAAQSPEQREYDIQIGSVPTLTRRLEGWSEKDFDVIIIDEAHHVKAESYKRILKEYPNAKILGVTATPYRLNGAGFREEFEQLIVSDPVSEFIKKGYLCQYDYFSIMPDSNTQKAIESISKFAFDGDYLDSALAEVIDTEGVRTNIVHTYLNYAKGKKGLVYTINRAHNEHICKLFNENGIAAKAIDSQTDLRERQAIVEAFKNGEFQVLCNVNIFSEGFDCPDVEFIQLARPTKSLSMFLQQIGRGLRVADNKPKAIFLDNVGLYNRFGLPSATRNWQKHFDGIEVSESELKGITTPGNGPTVQFFDEFTQGNEPVALIHSSDTESESETNSLQLNEPKADSCNTNQTEAQVATYPEPTNPEDKKPARLLKEIKKFISDCNEFEKMVITVTGREDWDNLGINDILRFYKGYQPVNEELGRFRSSVLDKEGNERIYFTLREFVNEIHVEYKRMLKRANNNNILTNDEIERNIAVSKRKLNQQIKKERQIAELPHKLKQLAMPLFDSRSTPLTLTILYDPIEGVIVKKGISVTSKKKTKIA